MQRVDPNGAMKTALNRNFIAALKSFTLFDIFMNGFEDRIIYI